MADRIVVLRGGRIAQVGKPVDLYANPENSFVASFIGSPRMNLFQIHEGRAQDLSPAPFPGVLSPEARTIGVRPEHIRHAPEGLAFTAVVDIVERLGHAAYIYARTRSGSLVTILERSVRPANVGDAITFEFQHEHVFMFGEDGRRLSMARAA